MKYSKRCIQHNIYTIFEQISIFLLCIFSHTQIQCVTLPTREGVFILHFSGQEDFCISICFINQGLNAPLLSHCARTCRYCWKMRCMFPRIGYQFLEGILHISGTVHGAWVYLIVWSNISILRFLTLNLLWKDINPKWLRYLCLGKSNQQKSPGVSF